MRILSNDALTNLPHSNGVAHGGLANFARHFSAFAVAAGHEWIGFIQRPNDGTKTRFRTLAKAPHRQYKGCYFPDTRIRSFLKTKKMINPRTFFSEEIEALQRFIKEVKPDILFLNGYSFSSWLMLEAASREKLPIVVQHAGIAAIENEIYKHLYSTAGRALLLEMERDIVRQATKQVFLNEYSYRVFSKKVLRVPRKQVEIIPLPYEAHEWKKTAQTKQALHLKKEIIIGCVARWDRIKNHAAILDLAREAQTQGLPWRFECVTIIPPTKFLFDFKEEYRARITVVPPMNRASLAAFYRRMDLMILPSHFDVSPTVVMEAAGAGKPTLISPAVGWANEYKACKLEKWIICFDDPAKVVKRIQQLLKQPSIETLQDSIRRLHAPHTVFQAYLTLFTDLSSYAHRSTRL